MQYEYVAWKLSMQHSSMDSVLLNASMNSFTVQRMLLLQLMICSALHGTSRPPISQKTTSSHHITPLYFIWYHTTSHHITSLYFIWYHTTPHHTTLKRVTLLHMISQHTTSHHSASYNITLHHITSKCTTLLHKMHHTTSWYHTT